MLDARMNEHKKGGMTENRTLHDNVYAPLMNPTRVTFACSAAIVNNDRVTYSFKELKGQYDAYFSVKGNHAGSGLDAGSAAGGNGSNSG